MEARCGAGEAGRLSRRSHPLEGHRNSRAKITKAGDDDDTEGLYFVFTRFPRAQNWVIDLARFLVSNGVDALIDVWAVRAGEDLPRFMEGGVTSADRVLMICTKRYVEKADGTIGGVGYEKMIVTAELIKNLGTSKFIPVIRQSELDRKVPKFMAARYYIDLSEGVDVDAARAHLLRDLHNVPPDRPPLGLSPFAARMVPKATESVEETTDGRTQFLATLMWDLASVVIFGEELEHRGVNPWLDLIRSTFVEMVRNLATVAAVGTPWLWRECSHGFGIAGRRIAWALGVLPRGTLELDRLELEIAGEVIVADTCIRLTRD